MCIHTFREIILGQFAGMSAVQGGTGFPFFSSEVYNYFATGEINNINVAKDEIQPDPEVRQLVSEVCYLLSV